MQEWEKIHKSARIHAYRITKDMQDAEEIAQDVMVMYFSKPFLYAATKRRVIDCLRSKTHYDRVNKKANYIKSNREEFDFNQLQASKNFLPECENQKILEYLKFFETLNLMQNRKLEILYSYFSSGYESMNEDSYMSQLSVAKKEFKMWFEKYQYFDSFNWQKVKKRNITISNWL